MRCGGQCARAYLATRYKGQRVVEDPPTTPLSTAVAPAFRASPSPSSTCSGLLLSLCLFPRPPSSARLRSPTRRPSTPPGQRSCRPEAVVVVVDNAGHNDRSCGTTISDEKLAVNEAHFLANYVPRPASLTNAAAAATVSVYFHVISKDSTAAGGNIPLVTEAHHQDEYRD